MAASASHPCLFVISRSGLDFRASYRTADKISARAQLSSPGQVPVVAALF